MKYIIIGVIALGFIILAYFSFDSSKIEYSDFDAAKVSQKTVQIIGKIDKQNAVNYKVDANLLTFTLIDELNTSEFVTFNGPKPNNFDLAPMLVIKGRYESDKFVAKEIMTKCPSKYEGSFEDMKKKQQGA